LARRRTSDRQIGTSAFDFLRRVLFLEPALYAQDLRDEYLRFVMRWQQFTGPVMAKGLEDTAYYVHNSLISMNEVGGDPLRENPPRDLAGFHKFQKERLKAWPYSMNATATHDTKHGEDARARLNVLSQIPREWEKHLLRWAHLNQRHKTEVKGIPVPAPSEVAMLYQTLLGSWPFDANEEAEFQNRVLEYLKKAVREAKVYSEWIRPNEAHESALFRFAQQIFSNGSGPFQDDFRRFQRKIAWHGALNSLSQVLIKITAPGVPDFYQGTELWDFSMVDPDNRRPVDFAKHVQILEEIRKLPGESSTRLSREVLSKWKDGRIKLYLIDRALDFRRAHAEVYLEGDYTPIEAHGPGQPCLCAFARKKDGHWCVTVAPRLTTRLVATGRMPLGKAVCGTTMVQLPAAAPESWQNILTGERLKTSRAADGRKALALADVLSRFPVALLSTAE
jgi:(1->4)-alpha-D-glucan 1-alpha-D-glucosylmutase